MKRPNLNGSALTLLEEQYNQALTQFINLYLTDKDDSLRGDL